MLKKHYSWEVFHDFIWKIGVTRSDPSLYLTDTSLPRQDSCPVRFSSAPHRWSTPSSLSAGPLPLVRWTEAESSRLPPVRSTISSWSYRSSSEPVVVAECVDWCEPDDSWLVRENEPRRGGANVRWFAGLTVMIKLELFATIISVTCTTHSQLYLPNTCIITT